MTLKVGYPNQWLSLVPPQQHTVYGDTILKNEFEGLVMEDQGGIIVPLLAKGWTVNNNFTLYEFKINTKRRFSNGDFLSAKDVKDSWEHGLTLQAKSSNKSSQDVLYLVEGFENFEKTKKLNGLIVIDDETLQIKFTNTFRTALTELAAGRMTVYKYLNNKFIGTGPYILSEQSESLVKFNKNNFYPDEIGFDSLEISLVNAEQAENSLLKNEIDVYAFAHKAKIDSCANENSVIQCFSGTESSHLALILNGLNGRFFEDRELRQGFQSLALSVINKEILPNNYKSSLIIDGQSFLQLQYGRLEENVLTDTINQQNRYVEKFLEANKKHPLFFTTTEISNWLQVALEKKGVKFSNKSGIISFKEHVNNYYKGHEPDILLGSFSIASGDPDGIYHLLGNDGAISSPMIKRKSVCDLLEVGRTIVDNIDEHYKKVALAILNDVPFVHIGFIKSFTAYNSNKVVVKKKIKDRQGDGFILFSPK